MQIFKDEVLGKKFCLEHGLDHFGENLPEAEEVEDCWCDVCCANIAHMSKGAALAAATMLPEAVASGDYRKAEALLQLIDLWIADAKSDEAWKRAYPD